MYYTSFSPLELGFFRIFPYESNESTTYKRICIKIASGNLWEHVSEHPKRILQVLKVIMERLLKIPRKPTVSSCVGGFASGDGAPVAPAPPTPRRPSPVKVAETHRGGRSGGSV